MNTHLGMNQPAKYQIQVQGHLPDRWLDLFENWQATLGGNGEVTTLSGTVVDQAALHGILQTLYAFGLPILSVQIQSQNISGG
jgi:hypothetical protein